MNECMECSRNGTADSNGDCPIHLPLKMVPTPCTSISYSVNLIHIFLDEEGRIPTEVKNDACCHVVIGKIWELG